MIFQNYTFAYDGGDVYGELPIAQGVVLQALHGIRVQATQEWRGVLWVI